MPSKKLFSVLSALAMLPGLAGCGAVPTGKAAVAARGAQGTALGALAKRTGGTRADASRFYAHAEIEDLAPGAFAVSPEAHGFLQQMDAAFAPGRQALVDAIRGDAALLADVKAFPTLPWAKQMPLLKRVAALESQAEGFAPPALVFDDKPSNTPSYFDFDTDKPGTTGTVILYTQGLAQETGPYAALQLLVHEIRHSAQFQAAFPAPGRSRRARTQGEEILAAGFKASFIAQKQLKGKLGFCDFCSLFNEFEAFQSGNFVVGALLDWKLDTVDMGCYSSQYDASGKLKIDLPALDRQVTPAFLLDAFNAREKAQFDALNQRKR